MGWGAEGGRGGGKEGRGRGGRRGEGRRGKESEEEARRGGTFLLVFFFILLLLFSSTSFSFSFSFSFYLIYLILYGVKNQQISIMAPWHCDTVALCCEWIHSDPDPTLTQPSSAQFCSVQSSAQCTRLKRKMMRNFVLP